MSYCNILATDLTREAVLEGFRKRHVYASTDNILADVRCGPNIMGDAFSTAEAPNLQVKLEGTSQFAKVVIVKDNEYVYSTQPEPTRSTSPGATTRRPKARPVTTTCAASRRTARSSGCRRCGSLIPGSKTGLSRR